MNRRRTPMWQRGLVVAALALPLMLPPFASRGRAAEHAPNRFFVTVPDSVRPLTITADSLGDKWTGYDCLDSLNRQHNWQNIYKSFQHPSHDGDGIYTVVLLDTLDMDTVVADYLDGGCLDNAYKMLSIEPFFVAPDDPLYLNGGSDSSQWGLKSGIAGSTKSGK